MAAGSDSGSAAAATAGQEGALTLTGAVFSCVPVGVGVAWAAERGIAAAAAAVNSELGRLEIGAGAASLPAEAAAGTGDGAGSTGGSGILRLAWVLCEGPQVTVGIATYRGGMPAHRSTQTLPQASALPHASPQCIAHAPARLPSCLRAPSDTGGSMGRVRPPGVTGGSIGSVTPPGCCCCCVLAAAAQATGGSMGSDRPAQLLPLMPPRTAELPVLSLSLPELPAPFCETGGSIGRLSGGPQMPMRPAG